MLRCTKVLLLALALSVAGAIQLAQPASAATGDYVTTGCGTRDGQPYGMACDTYMKTDKCSGGVVAFRLLWVNQESGDPNDDRVVVFVDGQSGCNLRIRHRVKYGSQSPTWMPTVSIAANNDGWFGQWPRNRELCWTDYLVQRKNGTWLTHRHYSAKWGTTTSWRTACRTDA